MTFGIENGIKFEDYYYNLEYHSFDTWGLYLRERPIIDPPEVKTSYVDVPATDGAIDLTATFHGGIRYGMREAKFRFAAMDRRDEWYTLISEIQNKIHGRRMKVILDEDKSFYYMGRLAVDPFETNKYRGYITISGFMDPFKYELTSSTEPWIWDSFNFKTGIIRTGYANISVNGTHTLNIVGLRQVVVPTITVSGSSKGIRVRVEHPTFAGDVTLQNGTHKLFDLRIEEGDNKVILKGTGTVSIDYRGGSL